MISDAAPGRRPARTMAALAIVAVAAYMPALSTGFTADDFFILSRVKALGGLAHPLAYFQFGFFGYFRPVAFLAHAFDWQIWGVNAFGFHLTNVLLHAASTVLVFLIGRRLLTGWGPAVAGLLFALHPASHEAVYWIAARFDLLATFFTLGAVWCLAGNAPARRAAGIAAFALGLLSKESAISLLIIAPAWDVFIARGGWRPSLRRLLPLLAVVLAYALVRSLGADLDATGGERRLPKLIMAALGVAGVLTAAWVRERKAALTPTRSRTLLAWPLLAAIAGSLGGLLVLPATFAWTSEKLGFAAYSAFYLLSPVVSPPPDARWFSPIVPRDALAGLFIVLVVLVLARTYGRLMARRDEAVFLVIFVAAALLPVSSMTGGLRYLYLASAGVTLLASWLLRRVPRAGIAPAGVLVAVVLAVSCLQLVQAGRAWRRASDATNEGIRLMAASLEPCGTKDVLMLTAPVGIGGVYSNVYWEAFDVLTGCSPKSFTTLLRVVGTDVHVDTAGRGGGLVELRIANYQGNVVASEDLRNFGIAIPRGHSATIRTAAGSLETFPEGTSQVFRASLAGSASAAVRFVYSDGMVKAAPPGS